MATTTLSSGQAIYGNIGANGKNPSYYVLSGAVVGSSKNYPAVFYPGAKLVVSSGGYAQNVTVLSGASIQLLYGAQVTSLTLASGAIETVGNGYVQFGAAVAGASYEVRSGGQIFGVVSSGAKVTVSAFGTATDLTVASGGSIDLLGNASTGFLRFASGAIESVGAGYIETNAFSRVNYEVLSGGLFNGTVSNGALVTVSSGGSASAVTVSSGGSIDLLSGASVTALTLSSGAIESVGAGYVQTGAISGVNYQVLSAGILNGTVSNGAQVTVSSGGSASAVTVSSGGSIDLLSGASVTSLTLSSGAIETVGNGYVQFGAAVAGASYEVRSGGQIFGVVSSGAKVTVSAFGTATDLTVASGGSIDLLGNASTGFLRFASGAIESVGAGYIQSGVTSGVTYQVSTGGQINVLSGQSASNVTVSSGGTIELQSGATGGMTLLSGAIAIIDSGVSIGSVASGAAVQIGSGASLSSTTIAAGGTLSVGVGATLTNATVSGSLQLAGSASGNTLVSGGAEIVGTGATDVGATLSNGATMTVSGTASSTYISAGGQVLVVSGGLLTGASVDGAVTGVADIYGSAVSNTLLSGSLQTIESGGVARATDITTSAATQVVSAGGSASGTLIRNGGVEVVYGSASNETVSSGGVVTVGAGGSVSGDTVQSGGEIFVSGGTVTDLTLNQGALVDFANVNYVAGETVTVDGGQLEVFDSNGNVLASVGLYGGTYRGASYTVTNDGAGHALVSVAICYLEGTQILTPRGEVKVEALKAGDTVVTRFGGLQKIRWIGRQSFSGKSLKGDWKNVPVHIRAGALGDNVPSRDLYVSPGHSMLVDGSLLLAKNLVNGITITQGWTPEQVEYYQLDLGGHDCVLAEGAWSETFADAGTLRDEFHNAADFTARFPNVRAPDAIALCALRPEKGEALARGLTPVLARAGIEAPGKLRGHVDKVHGGFKVEGWAQNLSNPDFPVTLEVLHDDVVLGEVLACDYRPDLQKAGIGRGYHAFTFVSPIRLTADMHAGLSVRRKSDRATLGVNAEIRRGAVSETVAPSQPPRLHVVA